MNQNVTPVNVTFHVLIRSLSIVPLEILVQGPLGLHAYHKALEDGKTTVKRVPIMFIGQGQAGKTSLKNL